MKTETPILFQADMIRAILAGAKTQTRRIVKGQCPHCIIEEYDGKQMICRHCEHGSGYIKCRYDVDELWVKETWRPISWDVSEGWMDVEYRADSTCSNPLPVPDNAWLKKESLARKYSDCPDWRPSIFMPRWASRIQLAVKKIRVERVQDITTPDVVAEGLSPASPSMQWLSDWHAKKAYAQLWDSINSKRGFPWKSKPFVWVIEFERIKP